MFMKSLAFFIALVQLMLIKAFVIDYDLQCQTTTNETRFARGDNIILCWHFVNLAPNNPVASLTNVSKTGNTTDTKTGSATGSTGTTTNTTTNTTTGSTDTKTGTKTGSTGTTTGTTTGSTGSANATDPGTAQSQLLQVPDSNQYNFRMAYEIQVDHYSLITANGAYESYNRNGSRQIQIVLQAQSNYTNSPMIPYLLDGNVYPIFSLVVVFQEGKVKELIWDNGCWDSDSKAQCEYFDTGLYKDYNNYYQPCIAGDYELCDPKIYVSFIGTDSNGNYMDSAGKRISRFRQYSISEMYSSAKSAANDVGQNIKNTGT